MKAKKGQEVEVYEFFIENPFFESDKECSSYEMHDTLRRKASALFKNKFINTQLNDFRKGIGEDKILKFYENNDFRLPYSLMWKKIDFCKINGDYFCANGWYVESNKNLTKKIELIAMIKINPKSYESYACANLLSVVDEELTSGDKLIIKKIAKEVFYETLEYASRKETKGVTLGMATLLNLNEAALAQLDKYGFKHKNERILNAKL